MNNNQFSCVVLRFRLFSKIASIVIAFSGALVLVGWIFDIPLLKSVHPSLVAMKVNTAFNFLFIGISLFLLQTNQTLEPPTGLRCRIAQLCACIIGLIGFFTLIQYVFSVNLGIDQLLFKESVGAVGTSHPGRMAPNTAVNFILIGLSMLLLDVETQRGLRPSQLLILIEGIISLFAFVGYLYGVKSFYGPIAKYTVMAVHTAVLFNLVCVAILFSRPDRGWVKTFTSDNAGGILLRRMLPVIIIIPLAMNWLRLRGEQKGLYGLEFGVVLSTTLIVMIFLAVVFLISRLLNRSDVELKQREEVLKRIFDVSIDMLCIATLSGYFRKINPAFQRTLGYSESELLNKPFLDFIHPEDKAKTQAVIAEELSRGERVINFVNRYRCRDGSYKWLEWSAQPFPEEGLIYAVARDITEREKQREELREAKVSAEAASRAKSDFLANMSHELRTPLNSIIGFSEVLQDGLFGKLNEKQQQYTDNINTSGKHLLSLINDILDLSKVESGKMELEPEEFFLKKDLLDSSITMLQEKATKHNINLTLEVTPLDDIKINADLKKLKEIMYNLLSNAVKFTPDGGSVRVVAKRKDVPPGIEIAVEDTGIGIKSEDMAKLFREFSQIESVYIKNHEGTGLGLVLTKKLVQLHSGRIWAESEFGKGSRFTFTIPLKPLKNS